MKLLKVFTFLFLISYCFSAYPAGYSRMFVFGDSLSDVGNVACPEAQSNEGRWTNAYVWNEYLADRLGLNRLRKSGNYLEGDTIAKGDTNFAHGGAMSSHGTTEVLIPSVHQQVNDRYNLNGEAQHDGFDRYGETFKSDDLVLIWGGANNLFFSAQTLISEDFVGAGKRAANNMIESIANLIEKGAVTIVAMNLPDIGVTPAYLDDSVSAKNASDFSVSFNTQFAEGISTLKAENPDVELINIDVYSIFNEILANPSAYGIDDTMGQFINKESGDSKTYLFFDDVHPAEIGHILISDAVYNALVPEPSFYALILSVFALVFVLYKKKR